VGVCAAITPSNFPLSAAARKLAPALAAGCTVVLKPSDKTPLSALALGTLAHQAGLPRGALNIVTADADGSAAVGRALCTSPAVRLLSFTGSTAVGRQLMAQCADTVKRVLLELGGNAPFIVFDDADLGEAVEGAMAAKFRNAGQTCVSPNLFLVHESLYGEFVRRLAERTAALTLAHGADPHATLGPLVDQAAAQRTQELVNDAVRRGALLVTGGRRRGACFFEPTVLALASDDMLCVRQESFAPIAPVLSFRDEAEVVRRANATHGGLIGYFYSRDVARAFRVAEALECGMVRVNAGDTSAPEAPFGGVKQSGIGREGSRHGLAEHLELKYVCLGDLAARAAAQA
jgi:succinate-semialdehyde dehydrogenase/glutarate-semialdehyde dehydrogenase